MIDWTLGNDSGWQVFHHFLVSDFPSRTAKNDRPWREHIRKYAIHNWPNEQPENAVWAIRVIVQRSLSKRSADLDNFIKPVVDAFSGKTLQGDASECADALELYPDDDIENVRLLQIAGVQGDQLEFEIWIYHNENN